MESANRVALLCFMTVLGWCGCVSSASDRSEDDAVLVSGPVTLLAPKGGEAFSIGDTLHVRWSADTMQITEVNVYLLSDDGSRRILLNEESSVNIADDEWTDFAWVVADSLSEPWVEGALPMAIAGQQVRIAVTDYEGEFQTYSGPIRIQP